MASLLWMLGTNIAAGQGRARRGEARLGAARQGKARQGLHIQLMPCFLIPFIFLNRKVAKNRNGVVDK